MTIFKATKLSRQAKALFNRICKDASQKNGGAGWGDNFPDILALIPVDERDDLLKEIILRAHRRNIGAGDLR